MSINLSLIGQMITFLIFVWFCMKFIWPRLMGAIEERQKTIADGLSAADQGQRELEAAEVKVMEMLDEAKEQASSILENAQQRANGVIDEAKQKAHDEASKIIEQARVDIQQETQAAKQALYAEVSQLALLGAEKIVAKQIDTEAANSIIDEVIAEVK